MKSRNRQKIYTLLFVAAVLFLIYDRWLKPYWSDTPPLHSPVTGKVVQIADGDTFSILIDGKRMERVRLQGIDAPEHYQAFGNRSRQALGRLIYGKQVKVFFKKRDQYDRMLGTVFLDDTLNVNLQMVRNGMAWHFKRYSRDRQLARAEKEARRHHLGLWHDPHPVPPWEWRREQREYDQRR